MAYLGKISAVLAANTQDFTRGLREAGQELSRFQKQTSGLRVNLDSNALDKTLTSLQRFEKTIQEIKKQIAANPDQRGLFPNPEQLQKQFRLFEDIGRPLTALKSQVEGLSKSMQAGLYPELGKIQAQFQSLYRTISSGPQRLAELGRMQKDLSSQLAGATSAGEASRLKAEIADVAREADGLRRALDLSNQARTVESMAVALQRLGRVTAAAADFGKLTKSLDASGVGASFYQPRAKDALIKTAALRGRAEQLPAQYRGEQSSNLTQLAETNSQEIEAQVAKLLKIESMIARRGEKSNLVAARGMAQGNLDRLSTKQEYLNTKLQREIASANIGEVVSQPQQQSAVRLTSQFKSLAASLREAAGTRFDPLIKSVGGIIEQLNRGTTTAEKAKAAINSLAAAGRGFSLVSRLESKADSTFRSQSDIDRESIRRQAALERNVAMASPEVPVAARSRMVGLATTREEAGLERESFNRSVIPRFEGLEAAASKIPSSGIQKELQAIRQLSMAADASLRKAFSAEQPVDSKNSLSEFRGQLASLLPMYDKLEAKIKKFTSSDTDALAQRFASLSSTLRGISGTQFEPLIGSVGRVVEQLNRGAVSADKAKAAIEKLAAASRGTQLVGSMEDKAIASLRTKQSLDRETIRRQGQIERSNAPYSGEIGPLTEKQQKKRDNYLASSQTRQDAGLAREEFNRTMLPRFEKLQKSAEDTGDTRAIKQAQDMIRLANQMDAALRKAFSSQDPAIAAQNLAKYQSQLAGLLPALDRAEKKTKTLADAQKQYEMFTSASGGKGGKLDPVLEGAASDIMTARQFRGQFAEGNLKGRVAVSQEIMRVEGEILRLTKIRQLIEDKPGLSNDKRAKAYERNRKEIEAQTQALLKLTAAESGGVFREDRVLAAAQRARKNTGSFGIPGAAAGQLAIQQALFAVDDLSSATGGLEYKLRAVGNNITQMGLLLGQSGLIKGLSATTGLFLSLGTVLGAQVALAIGRAIFKFEEADVALKAMNGEMERSKSLAEQNTQAYRDLAESIKDLGSVGGYSARRDIDKQVQQLEKKQKEQRETRVAAVSPEVNTAKARRELLEKKYEETRDPGQRAAVAIDIEAAKKEEKRAREVAMTPPDMSTVQRAIQQSLDAEADAIRNNYSQKGTPDRPSPSAARRFAYGELEESRRRYADAPKTASEAIAAIDSRVKALKTQQEDTPSGLRFMSNYLPRLAVLNPNARREVDQFRERDRLIAELTKQREQIKAAGDTDLMDKLNKLSGRAIAAERAAQGASSSADSAGVDSDIRGQLDKAITERAIELGKALEDAQKAIEAGDTTAYSGAETRAESAVKAVDASVAAIDKLVASIKLGSEITTQARLESGASRIAGLGPSEADTQIARAKAAYEQASKDRDRAVTRGDTAGVDAADMKLTVIRNFATSLDKAAYAVESFSRAAATAATELSRTLVQEAKSNADQLRRRVNKLAGDPLEGRQSKDDLAEARKQQAQQEQDDRDMRRAVAAERLAFENDVKNGRDPAGAALLNRIQAGKDAENNKELTPAQQEARRADAEQAQAELDARIALRPGVVAQADKVNARDAAVQAKLEAERVRREQISLGMQAADSSADAAKRMFSETGNVGGAIGARGIEDKIRDVRRKIGEAPVGSTVSKELEDELKRLQNEADKAREIAVTALVEKRQKAGTGFDAQMKAAQREMQGIEISGLQAPMTELEVRRADLERRKDEAVAAKDPKKAAGIQAEIDATDKLAAELNAAAIAVAAFQQAANKAAMDLQNSVAREAEGMANEARRTANEAEAVFGAGAPKTKEERERQARLEADAKAAQKERDSAQAEIDAARVKHEEEIRGGMNPAAAARAEEIRKNEEIANDQKRTPAERQAAKNEADRLRREQETEFEARPEVKDARRRADEADVRLQKAKSAERGRDLGKSEMDRRKEDIDRKAGDIGNATDQMKKAGDRAGAEDLAKRAAVNMARDAAPLYAQFGDELMTARLQGPSRAALNASDIQTSEGAKELNRLLRGEDSAKDVNLAEMQKQSGLLERIEAAIENSTGFNVL